MQISQYPMF